jgi:chromosomal replication initiator protein
MLLIDDIHFLGGKERMQEEFFHTFNALFDNHKQLVLTCDRPASEIPGLEHRLVSRFEWGLVTELESPDIETRIAILRKKGEQLKLTLPDDVLLFIAEHIRSNIRRLEGALIRAASYSSLTGRPMTPETLEYLLRDTLDQEQREIPSMESIQRVVADYYDIRFGDMVSKRRPQSIAFPRQVAMYLCRTLTQHSLPTIGTAFGRNHATVLHACRLIEQRSKADATLRQTLSVLNQRLHKR